MQTPKVRNSPSEAPRKISPRVISSEVAPKISPRAVASEVPQKHSPRVAHQLKTNSRDSDSASPSNQAIRTPKERTSKASERKSPRTLAAELPKNRPNRVTELELQISQLQNDLKKLKEQLDSSEARKKQAQQDAEESKKQLLAMSIKLEESQQLVLEKSDTKEANVDDQTEDFVDPELALQSQLDTFKKQHSVESAASVCAVNEIRELKVQLEVVAESEATQTKQAEVAQNELKSLKESLTETLGLMEDMKNQVRDSKESEARAQGLVAETLIQLETAKRTVVTLRSDGLKVVEAYDATASDLKQSKAQVNLLEELVSELKSSINTASVDESKTAVDLNSEFKASNELENSIEAELNSLKSEVEQLRSALEAAEIRHNEEQTQSASQLKNTSEVVEQIKNSSNAREAELKSELNKSRAEIEELKANLMDKETELQGICEENESLNMRLENIVPAHKEFEFEKEIHKAKADIENLRSTLMDKETELQNILEENEIMKLELKKKESNKEVNDDIVSELEAARTAEREALMKLGYLNEEVDKSNRKVSRMSEQLQAAQTSNMEMETELRRLKVQSDQWRKAAEAAAAMLSTGNNGKVMDRAGSIDSKYSPKSGRMNSPYSDDGNDDFIKKKNPNVLKKIGVLWKKPHK